MQRSPRKWLCFGCRLYRTTPPAEPAQAHGTAIEELPEPPEGLNMSAEMADDWGFEERIAERKERLAGQGA
ncbi:hypothetical protein [Candidatus Darwinibacter acetoxidans]